ncbi:MAG: PspA/IM30 family protein [Verrucomicrobiaceae bacterium]|nr:PspA/IM30 family protein [Verrucomicrobiaceae bacterium]
MFQRLSNLIRGFLSLFISGLEKRNPEALLELEKENLRKQIAQFNQGLAAHAGLCEKLISQVKRLEREEQDLKAKAAANLRAGNQRLAGEIAYTLQKVRRELADNRSQLEDADKTYKELTMSRDTAIKTAREKIETLRKDLDDLKMKKALAEMNEMASGMLTQIGGSGDTLDRLHSMVEEERTKAAGRARVARDSIDTSSFKEDKAEREALEDMALADLAAEMGMSVPGAAAPAQTDIAPPKKEMSAQ